MTPVLFLNCSAARKKRFSEQLLLQCALPFIRAETHRPTPGSPNKEIARGFSGPLIVFAARNMQVPKVNCDLGGFTPLCIITLSKLSCFEEQLEELPREQLQLMAGVGGALDWIPAFLVSLA